MVGRNVYISVFLTGLVFAILSQIANPETTASITLIYISIVSILLIKLIDEWRYYRSYNAPLASAIFVTVPAVIAIGGSLIAFSATLGDQENFLQNLLIEMSLNLEVLQLESFYLYLNLFSLFFCLPFFIILSIVFRRYYSGRYPNIFIYRRRFPSESLIALNVGILIIFIVFWFDQKTIEISSLLFLLFTILTFIQNYIMKFVIIPFRRSPRPSRSESFTRRRSTSPSQVSRTTTQSNSRISPTSRSQNAIRSTPRRSTIHIAPPVQVTRRKKRKLTPALIASLTPAGQNITMENFRCIQCYEYLTDTERQVVICPHCKHPSHADEFQKWLEVSNICSRCNKPINTVKMIRISGPSYQKIIQMFRKKYNN